MEKRICAVAVALSLLGVSQFAVAQSDSPPSSPTDLATARYDGAGGELFWSRSTDDIGVQGYEVTVNGRSVGVLDATSYYDASLDATTAFTFTVTAIDSAGQRSGTVSVILNSPGDSSTSVPSPANLTGTVYSSTAAELFWTRSDIPGLQYEVLRDGDVVATTDGTSYFTDDLAPNQSYNFEVIAIDGSGARSEASVVSLLTNPGEGGGAPSTPENTFAEITPANLRLTVYSSTAAELFWTPPTEFTSLIQSNEVRRNGVLVATLQGFGLRSYFDSDREPGTSYTYEVTAVAAQGTASAQVSDTTTPVTPIPPTAPSLDIPADVLATLDATFEIINGESLATTILIIDRLASQSARADLGFRETGETSVNSNGFNSNVSDCPNGGQLLDSIIDEDVSTTVEIEAIDCAVGSVVFSFFSQNTRSSEPDSGVNLADMNAVDIVLDDARDLSTTNIEQLFSGNDPNGLTYTGFGINVERAQGSYSATVIRGAQRDDTNRLPDGSLGLTVTAGGIIGLNAEELSITTLGPLEFTDGSLDGQPTAGRVLLASQSDSAADSLLIDAFNGDPSSFNLTATQAGVTTTYTVPFSDTRRFADPIIDGVDISF